ncbi:hypothetical protein BJX65DRAFT_291089 [Aspergillus insuetus]
MSEPELSYQIIELKDHMTMAFRKFSIPRPSQFASQESFERHNLDILRRYLRFSGLFLLFAGFVTVVVLAILICDNLPTTDPTTIGYFLTHILLCSSGMAAITSAFTSLMLRFRFDGIQAATEQDLFMAEIPPDLLLLSVIELLAGMTCWSLANIANIWYRAMLFINFALLAVICLRLSLGMYDEENTVQSKGSDGSANA